MQRELLIHSNKMLLNKPSPVGFSAAPPPSSSAGSPLSSDVSHLDLAPSTKHNKAFVCFDVKNAQNKGREINLQQVARLREDKRGHVSASLGVDGRNFCHLFTKRSPRPRRLPYVACMHTSSRVQVISDQGRTLTASHGLYRMCIYVQRDKEPRRLTATAGAG